MITIDTVKAFIGAFLTARLIDALLALLGAFPLCWAIEIAHHLWLPGLPLLGFWGAALIIFFLRASGLVYADYGDD